MQQQWPKWLTFRQFQFIGLNDSMLIKFDHLGIYMRCVIYHSDLTFYHSFSLRISFSVFSNCLFAERMLATTEKNAPILLWQRTNVISGRQERASSINRFSGIKTFSQANCTKRLMCRCVAILYSTFRSNQLINRMEVVSLSLILSLSVSTFI